MKKTNLTYVKQSYGVNENQKFVKCVLDYEINLDKIQGIEILAQLPEFDDFINTLVYTYNVPFWDTDCNGNYSTYGVLQFTTNAIANCAPEDVFDAEIGRKLALTRAQRYAFNDARKFYGELINMVENKFEPLYRLEYGCAKSERKCRSHEHELTGHEQESYYVEY